VQAGRLTTITESQNPLGSSIAGRDHDGDQATLKVWADSYAQSLELCRSLGVDDTLPAAVMQNFKNAINAGYGDKELSAIFEVLLSQEKNYHHVTRWHTRIVDTCRHRV
jgi:hypothetical protein